MSPIGLFIATVACLATVVQANLAVMCERNLDGKIIYGGIPEFKVCGDYCQCYVFELQCQVRYLKTELYTLKSLTYAESLDCIDCICNTETAEWSLKLWDGKALPLTPKLPVAAYDTFVNAAGQRVTPNYAREVLGYLSSQATPSGTPLNVVNEPFNDRLTTEPATFIESTSRRNPAHCIGNVQCELHYNLDWSYRLRVNAACSDADTADICFGTDACLCNNGYFRVERRMPSIPRDYSGDSESLLTYAREFYRVT